MSDDRAWPEHLTADLKDILGMMCFQLGPIAHVYQRAGEFSGEADEPLKKRAEDEQAFMLHKLVGLWFQHGADWRTVAADDIQRVSIKADAQPERAT